MICSIIVAIATPALFVLCCHDTVAERYHGDGTFLILINLFRPPRGYILYTTLR